MTQRLKHLLCFATLAALTAACGNPSVETSPDVSPGGADVGAFDAGRDAGPGDIGPTCPSERVCGAECCGPSQTCEGGKCVGCDETEEELCGRLGKDCGPLAADDVCGKPRTVASCGVCKDGTSCDALGKCVPCKQETDKEFCDRLKKNCGSFKGDDNCGKQRTANCGSCQSGTCDLPTNTCACTRQTREEFCAAKDVQCGVANGKDNCNNTDRTETCGDCGAAEFCNAQQHCEVCVQTDETTFCQRLGISCGQASGTECGVTRTVANCGPCTSPKVCDNGTCSNVNGPSNDDCSLPKLLTFDPTTGLLPPVSGDTTNATDDTTSTCNSSNTGKDVVYEFHVPSPKVVEFVATPSPGSALKPVLFIRRACSDKTASNELGCVSKSSVAEARLTASLLAGTYYLWLDGWSSTSNGPFTLTGSMIDSPANDNCTAPAPLAFDPVTGVLTPVVGNTTAALNDGDGTCVSSTGKDLVYQFELASAKTVEFTATPDTGSGLKPNLYVRTACGDKASEVGCMTAGSAGAAGTLTIYGLGQGTYYLWVDGASSTANGPFTLTGHLSNPPPVPNNDTCRSPEPLAVGSTGTVSVPGTTRGATDDYTSSCATASLPFTGGDVVYSFRLGMDRSVTAKVTRNTDSLTYNPAVYIRSSNCTSQASADQLACGTNSTGTATASAKLLAAGDYYIIVDGISGTTGNFTLEVTTAEPVQGDDCSAPIPLNFGANNSVTVTGDTSDTRLTSATSQGCGGLGPDLVYTFSTSSPKIFSATVTPTGSMNLQPVISLRSACASSTSELACKDGGAKGSAASISVQSLPAGTYYLWVDTYASASWAGPFTMNVALLAPPANDSCTAPETLNFVGDVAQATGDTRAATNDGDGLCQASTGADVVYKLELPVEKTVDIEVTPDVGSGLRPNIYLRSACGQSSPQVFCASAAAVGGQVKYTVPRLTGTHYLWVDSYSSSTTGPFSLKVTTTDPGGTPFNDACARPYSLTIDAVTNKAIVTGEKTTLATNFYTGRCATGTAAHDGPDLVYSVELSAAASLTAKVTRSATTPTFRPAVYIRKTLCESTAVEDQAACANDSSDTATATQINASPGTYYVIVDGIAGTFGEFDLEVSLAPQIDQPDNCFAPKFVDVSSGSATVSGDASQALNDGDGNCVSGTGKDLVYRFTTTDWQDVDITVTPTTGSALRPNIYVRSTCDGKVSEVGCVSAASATASTLSLVRLPAGTWYVWVDGWSATTVGPFTMNIQVKPVTGAAPNPVCASAEVLQFTGDKATRTGDTRLASNDYAGTCNAAMPGGDLVYSLNIPNGPNKKVVAKVTRGSSASTSFEPAVYIRSPCASAAAADEKACAKHSSGVATAIAGDLPPGDYYVIVDSLTATGGAFTLEVTVAPVFPDNCSSPQLLTFDRSGRAFITADTTNATADAASLNCTHSSNGRDLVYKIDTRAMGTRDLTATMVFNPAGAKYPLLYLRTVCDTTVSAEEIACAYKGSSAPVTLTKAGLTPGVYYLWADSGYSGDNGPFDLEVLLNDPVPNDTCNAPEELTFSGNQATDFGFTTGAKNDYTGTCATMSGPDVVYTFTIPQPDPKSVIATVRRDPAFPNYQPAIYIRSGCTDAAATAEKACGKDLNGTAGAIAYNLAPGTYYLVVDSLTGFGGAYDLIVQMDSALVLPDDCTKALSISLDRATRRGVVFGDTTGASNAFQAVGSGCTTTPGPDLVYELDTGGLGPQNLLATLNFASTSVYPALYLRSDCSVTTAANEEACARKTSSGALVMTRANLPADRHYLIVDSTAAGAQGPFRLDVELSDPPSTPGNDTCATAELMRFDASGKATVNSTTVGLTNDYTGTGSCASMTGPEAVYYFELTQPASLKATVTRDAFSSSFSPSIYLRRTTCTSGAAADQVGCATHSSGVATLSFLAVPEGTYYLFVDGATASSGNFKLEVVTGAAGTRGDTCADPIELTFDAAGAARVSGDTRLATGSGDGSCNSSSGYDLVYAFTLTRPKVIDILVTPTAALYPNVYVRSACDSGELAGGCVSKSSSVPASLWFRTLQPGTYYIWVDGYGTGSNGAFDMTVTATDVPGTPVNDTCTGAIDLGSLTTNSAVSINGDTVWATHTATGTCDASATAPDVYYRFSVRPDASVVAKVTRSASSTTYNPTVYIRKDCGSGAATDQIVCATPSSGVATAAVARLLAGEYYVVVDGQTTTFGGFTLDLTSGPPLSGDTCADAVEMPPFDAAGVTEVSSDTSAATNAASSSTCTSSGLDLVYKFTLSRPKKVDVVVTPASGSLLKPTVYLRSICDLNATEVSCVSTSTAGNPASLAYPTLAAGTYYVWVDSYESAAKGQFKLKVTAVDPPVAAPANDSCALAEELVFSGSPAKATKNGADTTNAVDDSKGTCAVSNGPDVAYWFSTSAPQKVTAKVARVTTTFEPVVYIRAACDREDASNEVACARHSSGTATTVVNSLPAGTWYVIVDGVKATRGTFNLEVTLEAPVTGPANDSCYGVEAIPLSSGIGQVSGTTVGAQNYSVGTCTSSTGTTPDVVYSVEVPRAGQRIKAVLTPGSSYAPALYLRDSCGSVLPPNELACVYTSTSGTAVAAYAGNLSARTYYLWVDGGTSTTANASGTFTLDVDVGVPNIPSNDTCARPEVLTKGVQVSGETFDATRAYGPTLPASTCSSKPVKGPEVVYSYTPTTSGSFTVTMKPTGFDAVLWYSEGTCDIAGCKAQSDACCSGATETLTISGVANTTYYIFVDGYYDYSMGPFTIKVQ